MQCANTWGGWRTNTKYIISFYAWADFGMLGGVFQAFWNAAPTTATWLLNPPIQSGWQRYALLVEWTNPDAVETGGFYISASQLPTSGGQTLIFTAVQVEAADTLGGWSVPAISATNPIAASNISTYISGAAIGTAQIANAAIKYAQIGDAEINTLKIAGNAVTIPVSANQPSIFNASSGSGYYNIVSASIISTGGSIAIWATGYGYSLGMRNAEVVDGAVIFTLWRDGVPLIGSPSYNRTGRGAIMWRDVPGAGNITYTITANITTEQGSDTWYAGEYGLGTIVLLETKR